MFGSKQQKQADLELFTIHDSKTGIYDQPMYAINRHDFVRNIVNHMKDPNQKSSRLVTNAEDYAIFKVGSYDKGTGLIESQNIEHVANLVDLKKLATQDSGIVPT